MSSAEEEQDEVWEQQQAQALVEEAMEQHRQKQRQEVQEQEQEQGQTQEGRARAPPVSAPLPSPNKPVNAADGGAEGSPGADGGAALPASAISTLQKALNLRTSKSGGPKAFRDCIDMAMQLCSDDADAQAKLMEALIAFKGASASASKQILRELLPATAGGAGADDDHDGDSGADGAGEEVAACAGGADDSPASTSTPSGKGATAGDADATPAADAAASTDAVPAAVAAATTAGDALLTPAVVQPKTSMPRIIMDASTLERSLPPPTALPDALRARALAVYTALRTFSRSLRLSPFGLPAFFSALLAVRPSPLYDEVHYSLLRVLAADQRTDEKATRGAQSKAARRQRRRRPRGAQDWAFFDVVTWPVFLRDTLQQCMLRANEEREQRERWLAQIAERTRQMRRRALLEVKGAEAKGGRPITPRGRGHGRPPGPSRGRGRPPGPTRKQRAAMELEELAKIERQVLPTGDLWRLSPRMQLVLQLLFDKDVYGFPLEVKLSILEWLLERAVEGVVLRFEIDRRTTMVEEGKDEVDYCDGSASDSDGERNFSHCAVCYLGGDLICCDTCVNSFHAKCIGAKPSDLGEDDEDWSCPECRMDATQFRSALRAAPVQVDNAPTPSNNANADQERGLAMACSGNQTYFVVHRRLLRWLPPPPPKLPPAIASVDEDATEDEADNARDDDESLAEYPGVHYDWQTVLAAKSWRRKAEVAEWPARSDQLAEHFDGHGEFKGVVTQYLGLVPFTPGSGLAQNSEQRTRPLWRVQYTDGDEEDLDEEELRTLLPDEHPPVDTEL
eukprot:g5028.t1